MQANKIDSILIAVRNLQDVHRIWEPVLGKTAPDQAHVDRREQSLVAWCWFGGVGPEPMESLFPDDEVAKFIARHGDGAVLLSLIVGGSRAAALHSEAASIGSAAAGPFVAASDRIRAPAVDGRGAARGQRLTMARSRNAAEGLITARAARILASLREVGAEWARSAPAGGRHPEAPPA